MAKKQAQQSITINGKEYGTEDLTDQQKALCNHVLDLDRKIQGMLFQLEQLQGGRLFFMTQLEQSLMKKD